MKQPAIGRSVSRGQVLVLFVLLLTALIGLAGLVVDGSTTYVQRRAMQNAADLAAMAGGYAYINGTISGYTGPDSITAARQVAAAHGFTDATNGTEVTVTLNPILENTAEDVTVVVSAPHPNAFSGLFGMPTWQISTTATVRAGWPNEVAAGALPLIFNEDLCPLGVCPADTRDYNEPPPGAESIPNDASDFEFNWTIFCLANGNPCNADTDGVDDIIKGTLPTTPTLVSLGDNIDPLDAGSHTRLFSDLADLVPGEYTVAIIKVVSGEAQLAGFATFHLTGSVGGSTKQVSGYFVSGVTNQALLIGPGSGTPQFFGDWSIRLID